jgi:hypothetical protein
VGKGKYKSLGREYTLGKIGPPSEKQMEYLRK